MNRLVLSVFACVTLLVAGCGLNENPPSYIKEVVSYREGIDGMVVYFVLADDNGAETTWDGHVDLRVTETHRRWSSVGSGYVEEERELYLTGRLVSRRDFARAKVGQGAFERGRIIYSFGRVTYSSFSQRPSGSSAGKVKAEFIADGRTLRGEDTILF